MRNVLTHHYLIDYFIKTFPGAEADEDEDETEEEEDDTDGTLSSGGDSEDDMPDLDWLTPEQYRWISMLP